MYGPVEQVSWNSRGTYVLFSDNRSIMRYPHATDPPFLQNPNFQIFANAPLTQHLHHTTPRHPLVNHPFPLLTGCTFSYSLCSRCCSSNSNTLSLLILCLSSSLITPSCIVCNQRMAQRRRGQLFHPLGSGGRGILWSRWRVLRLGGLLWRLGTWMEVDFEDGLEDRRGFESRDGNLSSHRQIRRKAS